MKFRSDANDLMKIERFCESFHEIYSQAHDQTTSSFHLIEMLRSADFSPIFALSHLIRRIIDVEKFKTSEINTVREHVSSNLDILRRKYGNLPDFLVYFLKSIIYLYLLHFYRIQLFPKSLKELIPRKLKQ